MRIGLMIGPERGRYRHKVGQLIADAVAAERDGFTSVWVPQIPGDFDAFTAITIGNCRCQPWTPGGDRRSPGGVAQAVNFTGCAELD